MTTKRFRLLLLLVVVVVQERSNGLRAEQSGFISMPEQHLSLLYSFQTDREAHPTSYPMYTGDKFTRIKVAGA
jgi:hypothetical protein